MAHTIILAFSIVALYLFNAYDLTRFAVVALLFAIGYGLSIYVRSRIPFAVVISGLLIDSFVGYLRQRQFPDAEYQSAVALAASATFYLLVFVVFVFATRTMSND